MTQISRDEWLAALAEVAPPDHPDAMSIQELCTVFGLEKDATLKRVRRLVAAGKAEPTTKGVLRSDGHRVRVPAYRLLK